MSIDSMFSTPLRGTCAAESALRGTASTLADAGIRRRCALWRKKARRCLGQQTGKRSAGQKVCHSTGG